MKFVRTAVIFDRGNLIESAEWSKMHDAITQGLSKVVHPPGNSSFVIRRKTKKLGRDGKPSNQWMRNGVVPIREQFFESLTYLGWKAERAVDLEKHAPHEAAKITTPGCTLLDYPSKIPIQPTGTEADEALHRKVGDFDFYTEISKDARCVIEWETGNISSTHRSMNKLCLVMMAGLIDFGVVVLPSRHLYAHLTDRIGNWMELSPYLPFWSRAGQMVNRGLLAVTVVEHDELTDDPSIPYITQGADGRSAEGASKLL